MLLEQVVKQQEKQVQRIIGTTENLSKLVQVALDGKVPVMPLKNSPETGIISFGLPIPIELRDRLLALKQKYSLSSYKAALFSAIRIGVIIMEKTVIEEDT